MNISIVISALICSSPLLFGAVGFYLGRYGSPIVVRFQRPRDRRAIPPDDCEEPDDPMDAE